MQSVMTHAPITCTRPQAGAADVLPKPKTDAVKLFDDGSGYVDSKSGNTYIMAYETEGGGKRRIAQCGCTGFWTRGHCRHADAAQLLLDAEERAAQEEQRRLEAPAVALANCHARLEVAFPGTPRRLMRIFTTRCPRHGEMLHLFQLDFGMSSTGYVSLRTVTVCPNCKAVK